MVIQSGIDKDYITLDNFSSAGSCVNAHGWIVAKFLGSNNRIFSLAVAAKWQIKKCV